MEYAKDAEWNVNLTVIINVVAVQNILKIKTWRKIKMVEIPRQVGKYGASWVVKLDPQTRKLLNITEVGETVILKSADKVEAPETTEDVPEENYNGNQ